MFYKETYNTWTQKQANVIYGAYKRGELDMTKREVSMNYNLVGQQVFTSSDEWHYYWSLHYALEALFEKEYDIAQAAIEGDHQPYIDWKTEIRNSYNSSDWECEDDDLFAEFFEEDE